MNKILIFLKKLFKKEKIKNKKQYYRIKKRKYSSNVVEKLEIINNKEKWSVYIIPTVNKINGDKISEDLVNYLNSK